ncbi:MAG: S-methyl-5'-thioadenosine phosphorylase [Candidatus Binatia bacterium]|nr:MAG: S-methyl-5'-thioadenosine phosphorylase [Candidatus Binatia bacterium]
MRTLAVIGGSGLYEMGGFTDVERRKVRTPFGEPSDEVVCGRIGEVRVLFLPRHGVGHRYLPGEVNYRANVFALKVLGAEWLLSVGAVGSLREDVAPGHLVLPDQFLDRTRGRPSTFFGRGIVAHVAFADPVCSEFRRCVRRAAEDCGATVHDGGVYVCMEGPQFSTRAESMLHRSWGGTVIGMTAVQEAKLAREAEMCFASLSLVTDYDCWNPASGDVEIEDVLRILGENVSLARRVVARTAELLPAERTCPCSRALENAVVTAPEAVPPRVREELAPLLEGHGRRRR